MYTMLVQLVRSARLQPSRVLDVCLHACFLCQGTGEPVGQFGVFDLSARLRRAGLFRRTDLNAFGGQI